MAQHFLLTAASRTLSLKAIYQAGEDAAYTMFQKLRWPQTDGAPVCPKCGCLDIYSFKAERRYRCAACLSKFSVTSGTILAHRKMSFVDLLAAVCILVNASKGVSMVQLSRDIDCQYKTAFVLSHKLREAIAAEIKDHTLTGDVEVDGAHFGGVVRPENRKEDRVDRRLAENQSDRRRVVVVARQRDGRTLTHVANEEAEGVKWVIKVADKTASIHADEASHWDKLHAVFPVSRINHSVAYSDETDTNQAESYFSRLRRMVQGQHHFVSAKYLYQYANDAAWREDHRRLSNGGLAHRMIGQAMAHGVSRVWKGYWQRSMIV